MTRWRVWLGFSLLEQIFRDFRASKRKNRGKFGNFAVAKMCDAYCIYGKLG
jgi:hypothetical protein